MRKLITYFLNSFLCFLNFTELNVSKAEELMIIINRNLAAKNFTKLTKFGVEIFMIPFNLFKSFNKNGSTHHISSSRFTSHCMKIVWKGSTHQSRFNSWESKTLNCFLSIFNTFKHHKGIIKVFEKWSIK